MLLTVEKREFLLDLVDIVNALGVHTPDVFLLGVTDNGVVYEDELLKIVSIREHKYCVVTRKMNASPIIILENDVPIRFHGEFIYLLQHVKHLMEKIKEGSDEIIK